MKVIFVLLTVVWIQVIIGSGLACAEVPERACLYLPILTSKVDQYWPGAMKSYLAGQVEQETCITLKHWMCWNPRAELKTTREYGFGLAQITITQQFNKWREAKNKYKQLRDWQWEDRFSAEYQLAFLVLEDKSLFSQVAWCNWTMVDRYACMLVGYNAGLGTLLKRRALAEVRDKWFGGLDTVCPYPSAVLYGKSLCERQNQYPYNIIWLRSKRYEPYFRGNLCGR